MPTLNEHGNIARLIDKIKRVTKEQELYYEIIIVDDNSTDGTINDIKELQKIYKNIKLIVRKKERGIGSAHIVGYNNAQGDIIISMDADLSHPPEKIPEFLQGIQNGYDMIMSSRYIPGGKTEHTIKHYLISKLGGYYLSIMLRIPIKDSATGYRALKKELWNKIRFYKYSKRNLFLIESVFFAKINGAKMKEIPIYFKDRKIGRSKTRLIIEALKALILPLTIRIKSYSYLKNRIFKHFQN
ncbi:MAG: glycosyltransferase [Promethearchaeota archaeon]